MTERLKDGEASGYIKYKIEGVPGNPAIALALWYDRYTTTADEVWFYFDNTNTYPELLTVEFLLYTLKDKYDWFVEKFGIYRTGMLEELLIFDWPITEDSVRFFLTIDGKADYGFKVPGDYYGYITWEGKVNKKTNIPPVKVNFRNLKRINEVLLEHFGFKILDEVAVNFARSFNKGFFNVYELTLGKIAREIKFVSHKLIKDLLMK